MNISEPFIRRPIGTILLSIGLLLAGLAAYRLLPVASLPAIDLPTILVSANRPGADPTTMASSVAAPLERQLGSIAGVTEITSRSQLGSTNIIIQFDLSRNIDSAAQDVQAAINASVSDLPSDLSTTPSLRKFNPNAIPILILAMTSDTVGASDMFDAADTVIVQRISQVDGVGDVTVSGADQPAIRVTLQPDRISAMGLSMDTIRQAIVDANAISPLGSFDGPDTFTMIDTGGQITKPEDYASIIIHAGNGTAVRLGDIAKVEEGVRNVNSSATYNGKPAILLTITKEANGNVIDTVDAIKALLPTFKGRIPAGIDIAVLTDRTTTIRASVDDMQWTLMASVALVILVVFVFLRRSTPVLAAGVTVPLSLAATFGAMWIAGFSIDNLSLMALVVSVGFVVDDAIVMVENVYGKREAGMPPIEAAIEGARQIGFTVISISLSLLAVFLPLFFAGGITGEFLLEFAMTLAFAVVASTVISLTLTPMILAHRGHHENHERNNLADRMVEGILNAMVGFYGFTLRRVLDYWGATLIIIFATIAYTFYLYGALPKSLVPQDDGGFIQGSSQASSDASYQAVVGWQQQAAAIIQKNRYVTGVGSSIGSSPFGGTNSGQFSISLVPPDERPSTDEVIAELRQALHPVAGLDIFMFAPQDVRAGGRQSQSQYQYTLWGPNLDELVEWAPKLMDKLKTLPGLTDINSDRQRSGLQANVVIDRDAAARLGVPINEIDAALSNAFAQRQISTIYTQRNQYRVVMTVPPSRSVDPSDISRLYVPGSSGIVPLSAVAHIERGLAPLQVNHQGQYPSITISYNLHTNVKVQEASDAIERAVDEMHLPNDIHAEAAGDARQAAQSGGSFGILVIAVLLTVYIVLGVLYESLAHPLTILSTLPSAGLGGLIALSYANMELTIVAFIGIILLIGIVKKNGIMMVDFALEAERDHGASSREAIFEACMKRFRPILMTTLAAILGALPLILATGPGTELRRPLGVTIVGGLLVSQVLTLYTTPVIYLMLSRLHHYWSVKPRGPSRKAEPMPEGHGA
ncbi:acriflavine resistance protein B [Labrys miyagiensis]|uniref:Acriflavine resistance protein B n=1 Tax=Labrys miyagiensis TaxID=346912 RepID=A0ABQ6CJ93_9HYPH|nr:efflux RND transporter permease subunit [Labrys miyagiensis]GLS20403.1 acriflavine resistance protein B [Labrys miyagiensis]